MTRIDRLVCHVLPHAFLLALVAGGRLVDLQIVRRDRPSRVEGLFLGRLERVMPDLDAAFVDIGTGKSGFLRAEDRAGLDDWPPPGAPLLVQVRNDGDGDKGPRLSMNLAITDPDRTASRKKSQTGSGHRLGAWATSRISDTRMARLASRRAAAVEQKSGSQKSSSSSLLPVRSE